MDDMSEQRDTTTEPPGSPGRSGRPPGPQGGPRVSGDQMRDVDRLRRSTSDRYIAGVAGGLGRHFDIDPTVIRVVLAVLTFFGGAGVVVYGAVWLFVPEDGPHRAPVDTSTDVRRVVLIAVGILALSAVLSTPFLGDSWGSGFSFPLLAIGLVAIALFATRGQRQQDRTPSQPWDGTPTPPHDPRGTTMATTYAGPTDDTRPLTASGQQPPAWMPPQPPAHLPPHRPRRTGLVLFWPTLALIAIALGTLGIIDYGSSVNPSAYFALAVAVTAVMLLVGAFVGRPGGLIALGFLTALSLGLASAVEASTDWETGGETMTVAPSSSAAVQDSYTVPNGQVSLDLSNVRDLEALDGRVLDVRLNAGDIDVILPRGINAVVEADLSFLGTITIDGSTRGGIDQSLTRTITGSGDPEAPTITLDIDARLGEITVEQD